MMNARPLFRTVLLALPVAISALAVRPACADEAADTATARALGIEGVTLAEAGKCKEAIEKLDRAERLHHAPTTATRLAECEIESGKLVAGTERLQRVIRERLPANAHPAFVAAVSRAQKALDAALPRIATLRLSVSAPPGTKLEITIDDEPVSEAIVDTNRHIDPGTHTIVVKAPGFLPGSITQSIDESETKSVGVELRPDPDARRPANVVGPQAAAPVMTSEPSSKVPAIIAFTAAAAGLGVGIYAATVVNEKASVLSSRCDANRVCPPDLQGEIGAAKRWATVSTVGFIGAGAGIATGVVLLLLSGGKSAATTGKAGVRPSVSASSVGLDGVF
jgi:hypothetical protein